MKTCWKITQNTQMSPLIRAIVVKKSITKRLSPDWVGMKKAAAIGNHSRPVTGRKTISNRFEWLHATKLDKFLRIHTFWSNIFCWWSALVANWCPIFYKLFKMFPRVDSCDKTRFPNADESIYAVQLRYFFGAVILPEQERVRWESVGKVRKEKHPVNTELV